MEDPSVEETRKVESQFEEEKEVIVAEIKSTVESGEEAAADDKSGSAIETQVSEAITESITASDEQVTLTEETGELVVSENVEETTEVSEVVVESVELTESSAKELGDGTEALVENPIASEENPEEGLPSPEETAPVATDEAVKGSLDESTSESTIETEAVETIKDLVSGEESKPPSLKDNGGPSLPQTDPSSLKSDESKAVPPTITEAVPEKIEEEKLPVSDVKTEESLIIHGASKENVPTAETTSTSVKERDENPTVASTTRRQHDSCGGCCGLVELLMGVGR